MRNRIRKRYVEAKYYYERGIGCDPRWRSFELFLQDMGERPPGTTLDRIDNDKGYGPTNCRWADGRTQSINSRHVVWVILNGERMVLTDAVALLGLKPSHVSGLMNHTGRTHQECIDFFVHKYGPSGRQGRDDKPCADETRTRLSAANKRRNEGKVRASRSHYQKRPVPSPEVVASRIASMKARLRSKYDTDARSKQAASLRDEGVPYNEIAARLGTTRGAVASMLFRWKRVAEAAQ